MLLEIAIAIDDQIDSRNKPRDTTIMDTDHKSFFSVVCDEIMTTISDDKFKITSMNFINALTNNQGDNLTSKPVMCTPFQVLVDKEKVEVSYLHAL